MASIDSGKEISRFQRHQNSGKVVAFSQDGKTLASGSWDRTIKLWDLSSGKEISTFQGHQSIVTSVAFSPDGKILATASRTIKLWNLASGKEIYTLLQQHYQGDVYGVAFSPDGKTLATASRTIKLWSLDLDDLLAKGCKYLEAYFITRPKKKKELCPES